MTVVYAVDDAYLFLAAVSIHSLLFHADRGQVFHIILLTDEAPGEEAGGLLETIRRTYSNVRITVQTADRSCFGPGRENPESFPAVICFRLFLAWLLPDLDRCLYLDADTLICEDISGLGQLAMEDKILAGVSDKMIQLVQRDGRLARKLGLDDLSGYINSGILVMNLERMRRLNLQEAFREEMKQSYTFPDQDIINKLCVGQIRHLDSRYNCFPQLAGQEDRITVLHYAGNNILKPWQSVNAQYADLWWEKAELFRGTKRYAAIREEAESKAGTARTISVCMIVKDVETVLDRALQGISLFADEIILVDTGSSDRTREIAAKYTDKIYEHPWENHFGKMRNISYSYATCDYVMWFDADQVIDEENADKINRLKETLTDEQSICINCYTPGQKLPVVFHSISARDGRQWEGAVHERLPLKEPVLDTDIAIRHMPEGEAHFERNVALFPRLTGEELQEHYWLVAQCYADCVMAQAYEQADYYFELARTGDYPFTDRNYPAVLTGYLLMYYGRYQEGLGWLELYLAQSKEWLDSHPETGENGEEAPNEIREQILSCDTKAASYAMKCAVKLGNWEQAEGLNRRIAEYNQELLLYQMNQLWLEKEKRKNERK